MKVYDKIKEKQLLRKFDKTVDAVEAKNEIENTSQYEVISWKKLFNKESYKSWVFNNFYTDLQLFFTKEDFNISQYRFVKAKDGVKKLVLVIEDDTFANATDFHEKLKNHKFDESIHSPTIRSFKGNKVKYSITFLMDEETNSNEPGQATASKTLSTQSHNSNRVASE